MAAENTKETELRASYERKWLALTREGQGCPGRVLRDLELRNTVVGKRLKPPFEPVIYDAGSAKVTYLANGEYIYYGIQGQPAHGKYWVEGDKLCHENINGKSCTRLIRAANEELKEEVLDDRDPKIFRLACVPMQLEIAEKNR